MSLATYMLWSNSLFLQDMEKVVKKPIIFIKYLKKGVKNLTILLVFAKIDRHLGIRGVIF